MMCDCDVLQFPKLDIREYAEGYRGIHVVPPHVHSATNAAAAAAAAISGSSASAGNNSNTNAGVTATPSAPLATTNLSRPATQSRARQKKSNADRKKRALKTQTQTQTQTQTTNQTANLTTPAIAITIAQPNGANGAATASGDGSGAALASSPIQASPPPRTGAGPLAPTAQPTKPAAIDRKHRHRPKSDAAAAGGGANGANGTGANGTGASGAFDDSNGETDTSDEDGDDEDDSSDGSEVVTGSAANGSGANGTKPQPSVDDPNDSDDDSDSDSTAAAGAKRAPSAAAANIGVRSGETLLWVPLDLIITVQLARTSRIGRRLIRAGANPTDHQLLASYLLQERYLRMQQIASAPDGSQQPTSLVSINTSRWAPWLDVMPASYRSSMPIFFTREELAWLKGCPLILQSIDSQRKLFHTDYANLCASYPEYAEFTLEEFICTRSDCFRHRYSLSSLSCLTDCFDCFDFAGCLVVVRGTIGCDHPCIWSGDKRRKNDRACSIG